MSHRTQSSPRSKGPFSPLFVAFSAGLGGLLLVSILIAAGQGSQAKPTAPGLLSKAHSSLEGESNCGKCHGGGNKIGSERCLACHKPIAERIAAKKGVHRDVTGDCEACHQEHQGVDSDIRPLDPKTFDHAAETGFAFEGKHAALAKNCPACHKIRSYMANQGDCGSCHADPHQGAMPQKCEACHAPASWSSVSRGFHKAGTFPLEGRHLEVPCASCHLNGVYKGTPVRCYDCHWIRRQDDVYRTALGSECENCHRPISWTAVNWDHAARTGQPLNAAHRNLSCDSCHKNGNFQLATFDCYSCHREDYEEASEPNHGQAGFPTTCELCHLPSHTSWDQASVAHNSFFPLQGVHATLGCGVCHKNGVYAGTPRDCYGCHRADYEQTRDPNHTAAGFPTTCETCHRASDTSWNQARLDHTWFPITSGRHAGNDCSACHTDPANFKVFTCLTCHSRGSTDGEHGGVSGYRYDSAACYSCHPQGRAD